MGAVSGSYGLYTYSTVSVYSQPDDIAQLVNVRRQLQATLQRLTTGTSSTESQQQARQIEKQLQQIDVRITQIRNRDAQARSVEQREAERARQAEAAQDQESRDQEAEEADDREASTRDTSLQEDTKTRKQGSYTKATLSAVLQGAGMEMSKGIGTVFTTGTRTDAVKRTGTDNVKGTGMEAAKGTGTTNLFTTRPTNGKLLHFPTTGKQPTGNLDEDALGNRFDLFI